MVHIRIVVQGLSTVEQGYEAYQSVDLYLNNNGMILANVRACGYMHDTEAFSKRRALTDPLGI